MTVDKHRQDNDIRSEQNEKDFDIFINSVTKELEALKSTMI